MEPHHTRLMVGLVLFFGCFLLTTWLEASAGPWSLGPVARPSRSKRSAGSLVNSDDLRSLLKETKLKGRDGGQLENIRLKVLQKHGGDYSTPSAVSGPKAKLSRPSGKKLEATATKKFRLREDGTIGIEKAVDEDEEGEETGELEVVEVHSENMEDLYVTAIEERAKQIKRKVYSCLPKFICEVHCQSPDDISTDLEREWLNMYSPSLLNDNVHEFQVAAHMGQLFRGYQPSPCHQLYTDCPITMDQLKKFLATLDIKKTRF